MSHAPNQPLARTDQPFRAWYLSERRRGRLAATEEGGASTRFTEDSQERETEDGQLRDIEA